MTGYLILCGFIVFAISLAAVFFAGFRSGQKKTEAEFDAILRQKAQNEAEFEKEKAEIMREVFSDAEAKKAALSRGGTVERFNNANDVLRGNAAN